MFIMFNPRTFGSSKSNHVRWGQSRRRQPQRIILDSTLYCAAYSSCASYFTINLEFLDVRKERKAQAFDESALRIRARSRDMMPPYYAKNRTAILRRLRQIRSVNSAAPLMSTQMQGSSYSKIL